MHKTYVELTLPDGTSFRTDASSHPHPKDPNFLQLLKIPLDIPIERIFAPCINVRIIDTFFGGLVKRTLGASSIDLANFLEEDPQTGLLRAKTQNTTMVAGEVMNDEEKVHKLQSLQDNIAHAKDMEKGRKEREHRRKEKRKQRGHYDARDLREGLRNRKMKEDQGKHDNHLLGGEKCVTKLRNKDKHNVDNTERKKEEGDINVDINIGAGGGGGGDGGDGNAKKQKHRMVGDNGMDVEMDIFSTKGEGGGEISDDGHGNGNRRGCNGDGSDSDDDGVGIGVFDSRKKDDCTGTDAEKKTSKSGIGFKNGVLKRRGNIGDGHIKLTSSEKPGKSRGKGSGGGEDKGAIKDGEDDDDSADESHPLLEDDRDVRISIEEEFVSNIERYDPSEVGYLSIVVIVSFLSVLLGSCPCCYYVPLVMHSSP